MKKTLTLLLLTTTLLIAIESSSQALVITRRGEHIGASIKAGISATAGHIDSIDITLGRAFAVDIDMPMYITNYQGVWLKTSYLNASANTDNHSINIQTIGVSLSYLWNPPDESGFFMTVGGVLYFPINSYSKHKETNITSSYLHITERMFGMISSFGINIIKSKYLSLNTGLSFEVIVPELPRPTIFSVMAFVGFTYRVGHRKNKTYYTKDRHGNNLF